MPGGFCSWPCLLAHPGNPLFLKPGQRALAHCGRQETFGKILTLCSVWIALRQEHGQWPASRRRHSPSHAITHFRRPFVVGFHIDHQDLLRLVQGAELVAAVNIAASFFRESDLHQRPSFLPKNAAYRRQHLVRALFRSVAQIWKDEFYAGNNTTAQRLVCLLNPSSQSFFHVGKMPVKRFFHRLTTWKNDWLLGFRRQTNL